MDMEDIIKTYHLKFQNSFPIKIYRKNLNGKNFYLFIYLFEKQQIQKQTLKPRGCSSFTGHKLPRTKRSAADIRRRTLINSAMA